MATEMTGGAPRPAMYSLSLELVEAAVALHELVEAASRELESGAADLHEVWMGVATPGDLAEYAEVLNTISQLEWYLGRFRRLPGGDLREG